MTRQRTAGTSWAKIIGKCIRIQGQQNGTRTGERLDKKRAEKDANVTMEQLLEEIEYMKRKHGLVNMDGTPRMGVAVKDVDGMPYEVHSEGTAAEKKKWREENGKSHWKASKEEYARAERDYELRKQGKPRGTSSAPDFDEKKARQAAKESAAKLVQATVANNAKTFDKLKEIGQDLSEGVAKKGKKIGLIVGGMVPFFGAAADAYGFQQDASDVGIDYATANLAADNTPGLEYLKGGARYIFNNFYR